MQIRDRIKELRRVPAKDLLPNPHNWRTHPKSQQDALKGVLAEIGYADALLARETPEGQLMLIDGHLRAETTPDSEVPVLVLDVTEDEAKKVLLTLDPLAAMATADQEKLDALLRQVQTDSQAVGDMLTELAEQHGVIPHEDVHPGNGNAPEEEEGEDPGFEEEDGLDLLFKSPYPWFGGKARVAKKVWKRFGNVQNYIEPFWGSGAVLLNRPQPFDGTETINDFDGLVCNFWRALQAKPDEVAHWCDWPVNENDLTARHMWLVERKDRLQAKLEGDPDYFDAKIAGWWCWGMSLWIGGHFCQGTGPWKVVEENGVRKLVHLSDEGQGVNRKRVHLSSEGRGVNRQRVHLSSEGQAGLGERGLLAWMQALAERIRRVRVCCGDWTRVCGGKSGDAIGHFFSGGNTCGIFLDPPYADTADRSDCYRVDDMQIAHKVREWAIAHGDDPRLRICLCGYEGEHQMPDTWETVKWKAHGGMGHVGKEGTRGQENRFRERLWFSPHCLKG